MFERMGAREYWTDGGEDNVPSLITAYKWLNATPKFSFPTTIAQTMKDLQCEMALFLLQHQPDIDLRMGLQAQGVSEAGIVKEKYLNIAGIPVPPVVVDMAEAYINQKPLYILDLERDEEQLTSYDAVSNLDRDD